jgi:hypothetical protein
MNSIPIFGTVIMIYSEWLYGVDRVGFEPTTTYVSSAMKFFLLHARQVFYQTKLPALGRGLVDHNLSAFA